MYAGDCALIISDNDVPNLEVYFLFLKSIDEWFCANNLKMNLK